MSKPIDQTEAETETAYDFDIVCDVSDTLVGPYIPQNYQGTMLAFIVKLADAGYHVQIMFSEPSNMESDLHDAAMIAARKYKLDDREMDLMDQLIEDMASKTSLQGKRAFIAIDDFVNSHRVRVDHYWDPQDAVLLAEIHSMMKDGMDIELVPAPH